MANLIIAREIPAEGAPADGPARFATISSAWLDRFPGEFEFVRNAEDPITEEELAAEAAATEATHKAELEAKAAAAQAAQEAAAKSAPAEQKPAGEPAPRRTSAGSDF